MNDQIEVVPVLSREQLSVDSIPSRTQWGEEDCRVQVRHGLADSFLAKSPADRALLNDQLEVVPVPSREKLAVASIPSRTQRDEEEHLVELRHGLVDAVSTKSPADRALFNGQLEVVRVPSREQLAVESIQSRTQRDEEEHLAQLRQYLVDALSTKSPSD